MQGSKEGAFPLTGGDSEFIVERGGTCKVDMSESRLAEGVSRSLKKGGAEIAAKTGLYIRSKEENKRIIEKRGRVCKGRRALLLEGGG